VTRREFITLLGGAAVAWPLAARAQQPVTPVVGFLTSLGQNERPNLRDAFRRGLSEVGFVEGRNVAIEYRFAEGHPDRLPTITAVMPPEPPIDRERPSAIMRLPAPSAKSAEGTPPPGIVSDDPAVN
jgi:hypothetical protein